MKKNPLFYERSNANSFKIAFAKRKLFLSLALLFCVSFVTFASINNPTNVKGYAKSAGISLATLALVPYAANIKGADESDSDFEARKGKAESQESFTKRLLAHSINEALKNFKDKDTEFGELKTMKAALDNCVRKSEIEALVEKFNAINPKETNTTLEALKTELKAQSLAIESLKEISVKGDRSVKSGSIYELLLKNKDKIEGFVKGKSSKQLTLETKATQTSTDITDRDFYAEWHEGGSVGKLPVRRPFIRQLFKNRPAGTEFIKYTDEETAVRDAKNVALCATSTHTTKLTWRVRTIQMTKIRDFIDVCLDMMDDYLFVAGEVQNLIDSSVQLKIDDQLLNGTGVDPELNSLTSVASTWAPNIAGTKDWTASIAQANIIDLIIVAQSQIMELGKMNSWYPNVVLVNPGDYTAMRLLKNTLGDTLRMNPNLFIDNAGNMYVGGMLIISNPNITANTFMIGDFTKGTVYARPGVGVEFSYENASNFTTETVTVKAYERLNLLIRNVDKNAFMSVPDVATALSQINKP